MSTRRGFLGQMAAMAGSGVILGLGLGSSGCAGQWEFQLSRESSPCTVLQATRIQYGSDMVVSNDAWLGAHGSSMITKLNGYEGDWMFRVNGQLKDGANDSAESVILRPGDHIEWVVVN